MHPLGTLKKIFGILVSGIVVLAIVIFLVLHKDRGEGAKNPAERNFSPELSQIEAKAFSVYDMNTGVVLFSKEEHQKLPLASITKLMTGFVALDILPETTLVKINPDDTALGSGTGLVRGESWRLKDLLDFSLITSSNDGIHAIASTFNNYEKSSGKNLVDFMNEKARSLGLSDTVFLNETGLDVDGNISGAYSSAHDVSHLLDSILRENPALIVETKNRSKTFISLNNIKHTVSNTNIAINTIPALIASKTGFTDLAGGNLAIVFDAGFAHPIIVVVLGSSETGRFSDIETLVRIALEKLANEE